MLLNTQRHARIEANIGITPDQGIVSKTAIQGCVFNHHQAVILDGMGTEGLVPGRFGGVQTHTGLEPLAPIIYETNQANRCFADGCGQPGQVIEYLFRRRIHDLVELKYAQALTLSINFHLSLYPAIDPAGQSSIIGNVTPVGRSRFGLRSR